MQVQAQTGEAAPVGAHLSGSTQPSVAQPAVGRSPAGRSPLDNTGQALWSLPDSFQPQLKPEISGLCLGEFQVSVSEREGFLGVQGWGEAFLGILKGLE